jgi:two-component system LytT family response regulator
MVKCIIVDDEKNCIVALREILMRDYSDVEIIGEMNSVEEAYQALTTGALCPDIVFLDIQMPEEDGFTLLKKLSKIDFSIIFTTAYDTYAIKAIRFSALDYLLKPINKTDLKNAIERYKSTVSENNKAYPRLNDFKTSISTGNVFRKLAIPASGQVMMIDTRDILYLESDNNYTHIFAHNSPNSILSSRNIGYYEDLLSDSHFFRIHNSYIINMERIVRYIKGKTGSVELQNNITLDISVRRKEQFLKAMHHSS